jgi:peptidyl-prolyl cis-trans isomerase B (cyclophilin B)
MTDITDFNNTENILDVFNNYYVEWSLPKNGMGQTLLISKDYVFYINGKTPELYAGEHTYKKVGEYYVATIREQSEVDEFLSNAYFSTPVIDTGAGTEEILVRESDNYYHYVTSKLSSDRSAQILEAFGQANVYEYVKAKYIVTRATFAIEQLAYYGVSKHGDEIMIANAAVKYNANGITDAEEMYSRITDTSFEQRTITVILDPDTPNERAVGAIARRGDPVEMQIGDSYKTLYTDRECTVPYKSDETYITDQTLYCKAEATITSDIDMNEIKAEINSLKASDFKESASTTDYVKISFKDYGDVIVRLRGDIAPITVEHFKSLVSQKFYDGLKMHRVIHNLMIQGGDGKLNGTNPPTIKGEFEVNGVKNPLSHIPGVISMARTYVYDSASSQFFIVSGPDALHLDGYYAGFGYVVAGLDAVTRIHAVETDKNYTPITPVVIEKICFVTEK